ncbi:MAG: carbonic anhydrase family protein [Akkermansiaceae bacterium]|nr:carbonic anhydrase family protein [Akkermansiaceae bacterium]
MECIRFYFCAPDSVQWVRVMNSVASTLQGAGAFRALGLGALVSLLVIGAASAQTTKEEQAAMKPMDVLKDLMAGNERYIAGKNTQYDVDASRKLTAEKGQFPKAVILSCLDSRVPVELVFDQEIGDIFVGRVAGNVENEDQLGSMEFATKLAGSKVVMVLGHTACGAVKGACDGAELGKLTALLEKIQPAVESVEGHEGKRNSKNAEFVQEVVEANVRMTVDDIRKRSEVLTEMEKKGEIMIVGAVYDLATGKVTKID